MGTSVMQELSQMVDTLTKQIRELEKDAKASDARAKEAKSRADIAEVQAMARVTKLTEETSARIATIKGELAPWEERRRQLDDIGKKIQTASQQMKEETQRLKQERHVELSQIANEVTVQAKRLEQIQQAITACKESVGRI